jgi:hypothetical protein
MGGQGNIDHIGIHRPRLHFGSLTMSSKLRQGPELEPVGHAFAVQRLLTDASNHLGNVDEGTCAKDQSKASMKT